MDDLDATDLEILDLLMEDARRPYSDIADRVDLSPPTVSERIDRLVDRGVIEAFTVDVDRDRLAEGTTVLVDMAVRPGRGHDVVGDVEPLAGVEHVLRTVDDRVLLVARWAPDRIQERLAGAVDLDRITDLDVSILETVSWTPTLDAAGFDVDCVECGNTVTDEGIVTRIDGTTYQFCCTSCAGRFEERYQTHREAA